MEYLRSFITAFGVLQSAGVILLVLGAILILSCLAALLLENLLLFTVVVVLSVLHGLMQVLFYKHSRQAGKQSVVYTLPGALVLLLSLPAHCQAASADHNAQVADGRFVFPFTLGEEPMQRLLVADFKDDPEYDAIEPQMFDCSTAGKGLKILMYRKDKKVDVYYEPGVHFDARTFKIGNGPGFTAETVMSPSRFDISENGVDIDIAFTDKSGRSVKILIKENTQNIHPFPFLAPVGKNVKDPEKLFAVYMKEFDFVRREGTTIHVAIGDRELTPANFQISREREKVYLMRYASRLVIGEINSSVTKPCVIENYSPGIIKNGNLNLLFNGDNEVQKCWIESNSDTIELKFRDGFPNLLTLPQNRRVKGSWQYAVSGDVLFGGRYSLLRDDSKVYVELDVTKKWEPHNIPFSFRVFTGIARFFRTWPVSYKWNATVDLNVMTVESRWQIK